jgi:hypothetical protein
MNPPIEREQNPNEPGKRLYFFPKAKTTGTTEAEARAKVRPVLSAKIEKTKKKAFKKPKFI